MARIRTIKPEIWESERLGKLYISTRLLFVGLISLADDEGRGRGSPRYLLGRLHPYAPEKIKEADVWNDLQLLSKRRLIRTYEIDGCWYYEIPGWHDNQKIDRPKPSKLPKYSKQSEDSTINRRSIDDAASINRRSIKDQGSRIRDQGSRIKDTESMSGFDAFWKVYPRKAGKEAARKAWGRIKPDKALQERILAAVAQQDGSEQWNTERPRFIPHPATWLNQSRWDDELPPQSANGAGLARPKPGKYAGLENRNR